MEDVVVLGGHLRLQLEDGLPRKRVVNRPGEKNAFFSELVKNLTSARPNSSHVIKFLRILNFVRIFIF